MRQKKSRQNGTKTVDKMRQTYCRQNETKEMQTK